MRRSLGCGEEPRFPMAMRIVDTMQDGDAYRLLMEEVVAGHGLRAVVNLLADLLSLPATVADEDLEPVHEARPDGQQVEGQPPHLPAGIRAQVRFDLTSEPQASTAPPVARIEDGNEA